MRRLLWFGVVLVGVALPSVGRAEVNVSVFDLEAGAGANKVAAKITRSLRRHVANKPNMAIVPGKSLAEIKLVFGCPERPVRKFHKCLAKVGVSLKARMIIIGKVRQQGASYKVVLTALDVTKPLRPRTVSEQLAGATSGPALDKAVSGWFDRLFPSTAGGFISLLCNVDGVAVTLDGKAIGECGMVGRKIPAKAGTHKLGFSKGGFTAAERMVTVQGGQTSSMNVTLNKAGGTPPGDRRQPGVTPGPGPGPQPGTGPGPGPGPQPVKPGKSDPTLTWKILFYSTVSAGAALLVASIFTGMNVKSLESDKEDIIRRSWDGPQEDWITDQNNACTHNKGNQELVDVCNKGTKMATVTNALIGVGAVLVAGSGYFLYRAYFAKGSKESVTATPASPPKRPTWVVTPTFWEKGGGVSATLRF